MALILGLNVAIFAMLASVMALRRARRWRHGRPAATEGLAGLLRVPRRYLRNVHAAVERCPGAARMHMAAAGGSVALVAASLVAAVAGDGSAVAAWLVRIAAGATLAGAALDLLRRLPPPAQLSRGAWQRFPAWLAMLALGCLGAASLPQIVGADLVAGTAPAAAWASLGLIVLGQLGLFCTAGFAGPFKHALAGAAHLAFHPRPTRFTAGRPQADLRPLADDAARFGTGSFADMPWTRLLSFDACVECGRCEAACPAFAAGQPLNPKALIQDLARGMDGAGPAEGYAGSPHPGRPPATAAIGPEAPILPGLIHPDTVWSCTTCRACVEACPMFIEHVDTIVDLRRFQTLERGALPDGAAQALETLRQTDSAAGAPAGDRALWSAGLDLPVLADRGSCDTLLWCGEGAFELRNQRTLRGLVRLLRAAGVDLAILGAEEADCGDLARRFGDEITFRSLAARNIATLGRYRFNRIVTADPHAFHCLRNEYHALGGRFEVLHHTMLLDELAAGGRLRLGRLGAGRVTYHDPCYLARYNGETEPARRLLGRIGANLAEMERSGTNARCCGGGGGAPAADIPGQRRIADMRMADIAATGAVRAVVACPNCMTMLEGAPGSHAAIADIVELLVEALEEADAG